MVTFVLILVVLLSTAALGSDDVVVARPGDHVRIEDTEREVVEGELLRVEDGVVEVRERDGVVRALGLGDVRHTQVSRTGEAIPDHSTRLAWILGGATFVGGCAVYLRAEDAQPSDFWGSFSEGLQKGMGQLMILVGTPLMTGLGWSLGALAENGEWRDARFEDDLTRRHDALRRELARDRGRFVPARSLGPSITMSF